MPAVLSRLWWRMCPASRRRRSRSSVERYWKPPFSSWSDYNLCSILSPFRVRLRFLPCILSHCCIPTHRRDADSLISSLHTLHDALRCMAIRALQHILFFFFSSSIIFSSERNRRLECTTCRIGNTKFSLASALHLLHIKSTHRL